MSQTEQIQQFFERNPLAIEAASSLNDQAVVELVVGEERFYFIKEDGKNRIVGLYNESSDMSFTLPAGFVGELEAMPEATIGHLGVHILKAVVDGRVKVRVDASFFSLMRKGYLGVLSKGGKDVVSYLGTKGFNLMNIKNVLSKLRGH